MANTAETGTEAANEALVEDASIISQKKIISSSHPGANPYACPLCSSRFGLPADLDRHVRAAHTRAKVWGCAAFTNHELAFTTDASHQRGKTSAGQCSPPWQDRKYEQRTFSMHIFSEHAILNGSSTDSITFDSIWSIIMM